jgi:hypothetical protein
MSDLTPVLQEMADRADATGMLMPHEIRGAGERRRTRLVVAMATCVVLGIVAAGLLLRGITRDAASVDPAGQPTPTKSSTSDDRVGFVGPPPPGTPPTGPATGELVAAADLYNSGTWVYADGRIINGAPRGGSDQFRGVVVRQLTPSGVEAMRSFLVDGTSRLTPASYEHTWDFGVFVRDGGRLMHVGDFNGCENAGPRGPQSRWVGCPGITDPNWLPASAWEDPTYRPFVPHSYQVCLGADDARPSPADALPSEAVDILLGPESPLADRPLAEGGLCRRVANPAARELADVMAQAGPAYRRMDWGDNLAYELPFKSHLRFDPVLPHGGRYCICGG